MLEETPPTQPVPASQKATLPKKKSGWFQKIPADILLSPGGVVLIIYFTFISILDLIPLYPLDQLWEIPLEIIGAILLKIIAGVSFWYLLIPFIVERLDFLGVIPSELIRLFF